MALWLQDTYLRLGFSPKTARLLVREQRLVSPERQRVLTDNIYNLVRKPGSKNANRMPKRGQQVLVIAQENLKLAAFIFFHRWRCTIDWEVMGVYEDIVHPLAGLKRLKDEYKEPDMLNKVNKAYMAGTMEVIKEYLTSCHGVVKVPLAYIITRIILVKTYGDYKYVATDDKMIARMLCLPPDKNKLHNEKPKVSKQYEKPLTSYK